MQNLLNLKDQRIRPWIATQTMYWYRISYLRIPYWIDSRTRLSLTENINNRTSTIMQYSKNNIGLPMKAVLTMKRIWSQVLRRREMASLKTQISTSKMPWIRTYWQESKTQSHKERISRKFVKESFSMQVEFYNHKFLKIKASMEMITKKQFMREEESYSQLTTFPNLIIFLLLTRKVATPTIIPTVR